MDDVGGRRSARRAQPHARYIRAGGKLDPEFVEKIADAIWPAAGAEAVILFGSAARGGMKPESDIDLLVVRRPRKHDKREDYEIESVIETALPNDVGERDIVVMTRHDLEANRGKLYFVAEHALREGIVLRQRKRRARPPLECGRDGYAGRTVHDRLDGHRWLKKALHKLLGAELDYPGNDHRFEADHAYQAVRAAVEGVIVARGGMFEFGGDLNKLMAEAEAGGARISGKVKSAAALNRFREDSLDIIGRGGTPEKIGGEEWAVLKEAARAAITWAARQIEKAAGPAPGRTARRRVGRAEQSRTAQPI